MLFMLIRLCWIEQIFNLRSLAIGLQISDLRFKIIVIFDVQIVFGKPIFGRSLGRTIALIMSMIVHKTVNFNGHLYIYLLRATPHGPVHC